MKYTYTQHINMNWTYNIYMKNNICLIYEKYTYERDLYTYFLLIWGYTILQIHFLFFPISKI